MNREQILDLAQAHLMLDNASRWIATDDEMVEFGNALMASQASTIAALKEQVSGLQAALDSYANPKNWAMDNERIARVWLEPDSETPTCYAGFELANNALASQPAAPVQPEMQEDLLDIVRTLVCAVDRQAERGENYPSPTSENSPIMLAARRACVERGYTDGGLAVEGVTYPAAPPVQQPGDVREPLAEFTAYVVKNYPADTIIGDPAWHAPRLFRAAQQALATTRPSAALTETQLRKAMHEAYTMSKAGKAAEFYELVESTCAILAASSGAVAVPEGLST